MPCIPKTEAVNKEEETGVTNTDIATHFSVTLRSFTIIQPANFVGVHRFLVSLKVKNITTATS